MCGMTTESKLRVSILGIHILVIDPSKLILLSIWIPFTSLYRIVCISLDGYGCLFSDLPTHLIFYDEYFYGVSSSLFPCFSCRVLWVNSLPKSSQVDS